RMYRAIRSFVDPLGLRNSSLHQIVAPPGSRRTGTSGVGPRCARNRPSGGSARQGVRVMTQATLTLAGRGARRRGEGAVGPGTDVGLGEGAAGARRARDSAGRMR